MSIILTSNGFSSQSIIQQYIDLYNRGFIKASIVVTADPEYREKDWHAIKAKEILEGIGFNVDFFDVEFSDPKALFKYDVIHFIGGNPFYLLNQIQITHADIVLKEALLSGKVISGASAGSIILGTNISLIQEFDPQMNNEVNITNLSGVGLTGINLCPHYSKFSSRYNNFEERICKVEKYNKIKITRINDGEAIVIDNKNALKI